MGDRAQGDLHRGPLSRFTSHAQEQVEQTRKLADPSARRNFRAPHYCWRIPMFRTIPAIALILAPLALGAQDKKNDKPRVEPEGTPLELAITGKAKYPLDLIGFASSAEYREAIEA